MALKMYELIHCPFCGSTDISERRDEQGKPTRPLHAYTIIDAIRDKNVLQFKVDYIQTVKAKDNIDDKKSMGYRER